MKPKHFSSSTTYFNSPVVTTTPIFIELLEQVALFSDTHPFFILVHCTQLGEVVPATLFLFLEAKIKAIEKGISGRRFRYQSDKWRIIFTFYPKTERVSERYALKNKVSIRL